MTMTNQIIIGYRLYEDAQLIEGTQEEFDAITALADEFSEDSGEGDKWYATLSVDSPATADRIVEILSETEFELVNDTVIRRYQTITLRAIEAAKIPLDTRMGCDDAEHTQLLDDAGIFRLAIAPDEVELQVLDMVPFGETTWHDCVDWPTHASYHSQECRRNTVRSAIRKLVMG
jgi:hypothetical protein